MDGVVHVVGVQSIKITIKLVSKEIYTERAIMNPNYLVQFSWLILKDITSILNKLIDSIIVLYKNCTISWHIMSCGFL